MGSLLDRLGQALHIPLTPLGGGGFLGAVGAEALFVLGIAALAAVICNVVELLQLT